MNRRKAVATGLLAAGSMLDVSAETAPEALFIEGYSEKVSYRPGEDLQLCVSCSEPEYSVEIIRMGANPKTVWKKEKLEGHAHPIPEKASSHGCQWPVGLEFNIPEDWKSGYYKVILKTRDRGARFVMRNARTAEGQCFFILRAGSVHPRSKILLPFATNTYNAYNNWGGFSLYAYNGRDGNQGHRVSFSRPPAPQFSRWEEHFVIWAENNGIELDYAANNDLEFHPEELEGRTLVLSVGHDEYWSAPMRDHLETYIKNGGNVAFFSGNTCCWQIRNEDGGKAATSWKQNYHSDPVYAAREGYDTLSSLWSHHLVKRPENQLTGVGFLWGGYHKSHGQLMDGSGAFTVHRPDHWILDGTKLKQGDEFGGNDSIVGYECDGCEIEWRNNLPFPTHKDGTPESFEIVGTAPAKWHPDDCQWYDHWQNGREGHAVMGLYQRGGTVFTCGSTDWAHGLKGEDPIVQRITENVIRRLS